jgi:hypothetical protein
MSFFRRRAVSDQPPEIPIRARAARRMETSVFLVLRQSVYARVDAVYLQHGPTQSVPVNRFTSREEWPSIIEEMRIPRDHRRFMAID